ncbi:MAG: hypothetical protein JWN77_2098 [Frankiales bacterium]|nr:hypothetical protein [Frankiales bacterium]
MRLVEPKSLEGGVADLLIKVPGFYKALDPGGRSGL